jgi:putative adhesin
MRIVVCAGAALLSAAAAICGAQREPGTSPGAVLGARHLARSAPVKIFDPAGSVRLIGWTRDSLLVRGTVAPEERFYLAGGDDGVKLGVEDRPGLVPPGACDLVVYLPAGAQVSVKTASASIHAHDVSGWLYSVSGAIDVSGAAASLDVESMTGAVAIDAVAPWIRVRTGQGRLRIRGRPQDVDASTISGLLDIDSDAILRAQFTSVAGDIRYAGAPAPGAVFDFSSHSGAVTLALPRDASATLALSSVNGSIENAFVSAHPAALEHRNARVTLGRGEASLTVRTFKGAIRLRARR